MLEILFWYLLIPFKWRNLKSENFLSAVQKKWEALCNNIYKLSERCHTIKEWTGGLYKADWCWRCRPKRNKDFLHSPQIWVIQNLHHGVREACQRQPFHQDIWTWWEMFKDLSIFLVFADNHIPQIHILYKNKFWKS